MLFRSPPAATVTETITIFNEVLRTIYDFVVHVRPEEIPFTADAPVHALGRIKLYDRLLSRHESMLEKLGYNITVDEDPYNRWPGDPLRTSKYIITLDPSQAPSQVIDRSHPATRR